MTDKKHKMRLPRAGQKRKVRLRAAGERVAGVEVTTKLVASLGAGHENPKTAVTMPSAPWENTQSETIDTSGDAP